MDVSNLEKERFFWRNEEVFDFFSLLSLATDVLLGQMKCLVLQARTSPFNDKPLTLVKK